MPGEKKKTQDQNTKVSVKDLRQKFPTSTSESLRIL